MRDLFRKAKGKTPEDKIMDWQAVDIEQALRGRGGAARMVFSEGSVAHPRLHSNALASAAAWEPELRDTRQHEATYAQVAPVMAGLSKVAHVGGHIASSTRAEMAGGIIAMRSTGPIDLHTDSKATRAIHRKITSASRTGTRIPFTMMKIKTSGRLGITSSRPGRPMCKSSGSKDISMPCMLRMA